ncbi:uncharacterized protein [Apostichopus japonicus]
MFSCSHEECVATFKKRWRLVEHMVKHTGEKPFACTVEDCYKSFSRKSHLQRHMKSHSASKDFECQEEGCTMQFAANESLKRHVKRVHQERQFKCTWPDCGKAFKKHHQLKYHTCQHSGTLPHMCDYEGCGRAFPVPSKLKAHKKTHEGYTCEVPGCETLVFKWSQMRKHKAEIHNRNFPCEKCGKVFKTNSKLKSHSKVHNTQREVFECPYGDCQRSYTRVAYLQQHVNNYHQGARPFACSHEGCVKTFANKVSLVKHKVVHEPGYCKPPSNPKRKRSLASRLSGFPDAATRRRPAANLGPSANVLEETVLDTTPNTELDNLLGNDSGKTTLKSSGFEKSSSSKDNSCDSVEDKSSIPNSNSRDSCEITSCCTRDSKHQTKGTVSDKTPDSERMAVEMRDHINICQPSGSTQTEVIKVVTELEADTNHVWDVISQRASKFLEQNASARDEINCNVIVPWESDRSEGTGRKEVDSSFDSGLMQMEVTTSDESLCNSSVDQSSPDWNFGVTVVRVTEEPGSTETACVKLSKPGEEVDDVKRWR